MVTTRAAAKASKAAKRPTSDNSMAPNRTTSSIAHQTWEIAENILFYRLQAEANEWGRIWEVQEKLSFDATPTEVRQQIGERGIWHEIGSILCLQTVCRTWNDIFTNSPRVRQLVYLGRPPERKFLTTAWSGLNRLIMPARLFGVFNQMWLFNLTLSDLLLNLARKKIPHPPDNTTSPTRSRAKRRKYTTTCLHPSFEEPNATFLDRPLAHPPFTKLLINNWFRPHYKGVVHRNEGIRLRDVLDFIIDHYGADLHERGKNYNCLVLREDKNGEYHLIIDHKIGGELW